MDKKIAILAACLVITNPISAEPTFSQKTANYYEVEYKNFGFWKTVGRKLGAALLGYDFLDWEEISIKTTVAKSSNNALGKVVSMTMNADYEERIVASLDITGDIPKGFLDITKKQELKPEAVLKFLNTWNYLYDSSQTDFELKVSSVNLLIDNNGYVHCRFTKIKNGDKYIITGKTFKSDGASNADFEIIVSTAPTPLLEKVTALLKSGEKIILTLIRKSKREE